MQESDFNVGDSIYTKDGKQMEVYMQKRPDGTEYKALRRFVSFYDGNEWKLIQSESNGALSFHLEGFWGGIRQKKL